MDDHVPVAGISTSPVRSGRNEEMKKLEHSGWSGSEGWRRANLKEPSSSSTESFNKHFFLSLYFSLQTLAPLKRSLRYSFVALSSWEYLRTTENN